MRYRWKVLALLLVIAIVPLLLARVFGLGAVRRLSTVLISQTRENLITQAQSRLQLLVNTYAEVLWRGRERIEMALALQIHHIEKALAEAPAATPAPVWAEAFNHGIGLPPDTTPSGNHMRSIGDQGPLTLLVAPSAQVMHPAADADRGAVAADARRLIRATDGLRDLSVSLSHVVLWQYTGLDNGLLAGYPAHKGRGHGHHRAGQRHAGTAPAHRGDINPNLCFYDLYRPKSPGGAAGRPGVGRQPPP